MPVHLRNADQSQALLYHARAATPFASADGEPYASIPAGIESRRAVPLRSAEFRDWLTANFYSEFEAAPSAAALSAVLRALEARASQGESHEHKVDHRISFEGDPYLPSKVILDLGSPSGDVVEITAKGWHSTNNLTHPFRQFSSTISLPHPPTQSKVNTDSVHQMAELFHISHSNKTRLLTWLASALRPVGPYPILVLQGPASSGKSFLARALRSLIDPSSVPLRRLPGRDRSLISLALENWVVAFDHVQRISVRMADALSALSSGDALPVSQFDKRTDAVLQVARPIILVAPTDESRSPWIPPRSLSNRSIVLELEPLAHIRPESQLWSKLDQWRPAILSLLLSAVTTALQRLHDVDVATVTRLADCAAWTAAAAPALGLDEQSVLEIFTGAGATWTVTDPVANAVDLLLRDNGTWSGDATALLKQLRTLAPLARLPVSPKGLSQTIMRIPGVEVTRTRPRTGDRILNITRLTETSASYSQALVPAP